MQSDHALPKLPQAWFFTVDGGRGRFLKCSRVPYGRLHVDEVSAIQYQPEEHQRGRPSPRSGKSGNTYASRGREDEYQLRRFAKEVVDWMAKRVERIETPSIKLFAAPRFLGELRKLYGPALTKRIEEHPGDLTHLSTAALAKHPAVTELLPD
jgi:protein required for attachment to host cells